MSALQSCRFRRAHRAVVAVIVAVLAVAVISAAAARDPNLRVKIVRSHVTTSTDNFDQQTIVFLDTIAACPDGSVLKPTGPPMAFLLTTDGRTYRGQLKHTCSAASATGSAESYSDYSQRWSLDRNDGKFPGWVFNPLAPEAGREGATQTFTWRFYEAGRLLGTGSFVATYRTIGGTRTIWDGTDDFINICINQSKQIRSQGGRLYCSYGKPTNVSTIRILK